jgi:hypothetical protein
MTRYLWILVFISACNPIFSYASELSTRSFDIKIIENCSEGEVGCTNVTYIGTSKKTGDKITLSGKAIMHMCPDLVTPCSHEGYEFKNGNVGYRVTSDGVLVVSRDGKILLQEQGTWASGRPENAPDSSKFEWPVALELMGLGIKLKTPYANAKKLMLKNGWTLTPTIYLPNHPPYKEFPEIICGEGYDAICSAEFAKENQTMVVSVRALQGRLVVRGTDSE